MQQNLLQIIERIALSTQITPSNTHIYIHLKIQRLQKNAKFMRSMYEKTKLANNRDWPRWNENLRDYIAALRINNILSENYEIPPSENSEKQ
jgi:hypothetical protein